MLTRFVLQQHYHHNPSTTLKGVDPGIYHFAHHVADEGHYVNWSDPRVGEDIYWALSYEGVIAVNGEVYDMYQCDDCKRYFAPGDTYVTGDSEEFCYADNGNGCFEKFKERLWAPPKGEPVEVEPKHYRVMVCMTEWRLVFVEADNPIEAKRLVEEEDWYGPEFLCESQSLDCEFGQVALVEVMS